MYTTDAPEAGWDGCVFCAIAKGQAEASVVYGRHHRHRCRVGGTQSDRSWTPTLKRSGPP